MQVKAQPLELKNTGVAFDVYGSGSKRLGDLSVTQTGLVWCKGASSRNNSKLTVKWNDFIVWMQSQMKNQIKAPAKSRAAAASKSAASKPAAAKTSTAKTATKKAVTKKAAVKKVAAKKAPAKRAPAAKKAVARRKAN